MWRGSMSNRLYIICTDIIQANWWGSPFKSATCRYSDNRYTLQISTIAVERVTRVNDVTDHNSYLKQRKSWNDLVMTIFTRFVCLMHRDCDAFTDRYNEFACHLVVRNSRRCTPVRLQHREVNLSQWSRGHNSEIMVPCYVNATQHATYTQNSLRILARWTVTVFS